MSMPGSDSNFGLRDYLSYVFPGIGIIAAYFVLNPSDLKIVQTSPLASSIAGLLCAYLLGHVSKAIGIFIVRTPARRWMMNPYRKALGMSDAKHARWSSQFVTSLHAALKRRFGGDIVSSLLSHRAGELVVMCWYDVMRRPSGALAEIGRYLSLHNLFLGMIPASIIFAASAVTMGFTWISLIGVLLTAVFVYYWAQYEQFYCNAIIRLWFIEFHINDSDSAVTSPRP